MRRNRVLVNKNDLTGITFDSLTVIKRVVNKVAKSSGREYVSWFCKCICGKELDVTTKALKKGKKSCGCLSKSNRFKKSDSKTIDIVIGFILKLYKYKALKKVKYEWSLSDSKAIELFLGNCFYCSSPPYNLIKWYKTKSRNSEKENIRINGIDRIDSSKGYLDSNTVSCCCICNRAKSDLSQREFLLWIERIKKLK